MDQMGFQYNIWIILLSFALASAAAYSALNLLSQVSRSTGSIRRLWLLSASCAVGSGIWGMHIVGMSAGTVPFEVIFQPDTALVSLLVCMSACYTAFWILFTRRPTLWRACASGAALSGGIGAMHYLGISSIQTSGVVHYELLPQVVTLLLSFILSCTSMYLLRKFKDHAKFSQWKLYAAIFIGLAATGLHDLSIRGSRLNDPAGEARLTLLTDTNMVLLIGISVVTVIMLAVSGGAILLDRHVLERMAYFDPLTGLPNRHGLERYFSEEFFTGRAGAVFFVDLDRFKSINDTLGHDIGDMLLQEVAARLKACVNGRGKVFRLGGDEFLIALPQCAVEEAEKLACFILQELKHSYSIQGNELYVTGSVGISLAPVHGSDRSSLMKAADTALYTSKDSGKNKYSVFDQEMNRHQLRRMSLEKDLRKALARSEFMVVYQPKWDSYLNVTVGLEALLRWRHPEHGIVSPAEFIPIAEETGLIVPITYWMLQDVCAQNRLWHQESVANVAVSVNMSARMFEGDGLCEAVEEALALSGLEPEFLELEITESIAMNNMEDTVAQLSKLRELGVRVSLDDFGTGFSSLGNLDEIPVNTLKIDQVFIRKSKMHSKKAIISNIIAIASNLNMEVVAEGVETTEQIELLQSLGCRVMQGYYYGRPMPVQELGEWFLENTAV